MRSRTYLSAIFILGTLLSVSSFFVFETRGQGERQTVGNARIRYANFAPFNAEDAEIYIQMNGVFAVNNFKYGYVTPLIDISPDTYQVDVFDNVTDQLLSRINIELEGDATYTLLVVGDGEHKPIEIVWLRDDVTPPSDQAVIRVAHFAQLVPDGAASEIDWRTPNDTVLQDDIPYGFVDQSFSLIVDPGSINTRITSTNGEFVLVDVQPYMLKAGDVVTIIFVGDTVNQALQVYAFKNDEAGNFLNTNLRDTLPEAEVAFANLGLVRAGLSAAPEELVVSINGSDFISSTFFGDYHPPLPLSGGVYDFEVSTKAQDVILYSGEVELNIGQDYLLIFGGDNQAAEYQLFAEKIDTSEPGPGKQPNIRMGHFSTFVDPENSVVDIRFENGQLLQDNLTYGTIVPEKRTVAGTFALTVSDWSGQQDYFRLDPVLVEENSNVTVLFTGDGTRENISYMVITNGVGRMFAAPVLNGGEASLYFANLGIWQQGSGELGFRLNGFEQARLAFGQSFGYLEVETGQHFIEAFDPVSGEAIASVPIYLGYGARKILVLLGDGQTQSFQLSILEDVENHQNRMNRAVRTSANLSLTNLLIFPGRAEETRVDFLINQEVVADNATFGDLSAQKYAYPPAQYWLSLNTQDGQTALIEPTPLKLDENSVWKLFATGNGETQPYRFYAIVDGEPGQFLATPVLNRTELYLPITHKNE